MTKSMAAPAGRAPGIERYISRAVAQGSRKWTANAGSVGAWIAESDFGTAPAVKEALVETIDRGLLGYLPDTQAERLRHIFATFVLERYGWQVDPEYVQIIPDVMAGLALTIELFTTPGSPIIVPTPAYMPFLAEPARHGREVILVDHLTSERGWELDLDGIADGFDRGAELLVLCNPHNPLGYMLGESALHAIAEVVDRAGGRVFADEIHAPVTYGTPRHRPYAASSDLASRHAVTATSVSKGWNIPGLKCAQLVLSSPGDRDRWALIDPYPVQGGSTLGVAASSAAYRDGISWLDETNERYRASRDLLSELLAEHLPAVRWTHRPEATYLAWLDVGAVTPLRPVSDAWQRQAGVTVTDGGACAPGRSDHVRFNFALPPEVLRYAIESIALAFDQPETRKQES